MAETNLAVEAPTAPPSEAAAPTVPQATVEAPTVPQAEVEAPAVPTVPTAGMPHPYHILPPSPWPILGAFAGGLLAVGAIAFMHDGPGWLLYLGFAAVIGVMVGWWRDVIRESVVERAHTPVVKLGLRYGMALFIASEVMFFVAFFWAFYDASLFPKVVDPEMYPDWVGHGMPLAHAVNPDAQWPPPEIETIDPFGLPTTMTLILLLSGVTVTWAHHALREGHLRDAWQAQAITLVLAVMFLGFQVFEYTHAHFGFSDGIFPSTFYMATGFHGFHVLIGTIFLAVCLYRTLRGHFTAQSHFGFEAAAWYWHFVDVVWLFLFVSIYWWGAIPR